MIENIVYSQCISLPINIAYLRSETEQYERCQTIIIDSCEAALAAHKTGYLFEKTT